MHKAISIALAALTASAAAAQGDPSGAKAPVPPLEYRSAFEGYRPFAAEKLVPWRESNEAVKPQPKPDASQSQGHGGHR